MSPSIIAWSKNQQNKKVKAKKPQHTKNVNKIFSLRKSSISPNSIISTNFGITRHYDRQSPPPLYIITSLLLFAHVVSWHHVVANWKQNIKENKVTCLTSTCEKSHVFATCVVAEEDKLKKITTQSPPPSKTPSPSSGAPPAAAKSCGGGWQTACRKNCKHYYSIDGNENETWSKLNSLPNSLSEHSSLEELSVWRTYKRHIRIQNWYSFFSLFIFSPFFEVVENVLTPRKIIYHLM